MHVAEPGFVRTPHSPVFGRINVAQTLLSVLLPLGTTEQMNAELTLRAFAGRLRGDGLHFTPAPDSRPRIFFERAAHGDPRIAARDGIAVSRSRGRVPRAVVRLAVDVQRRLRQVVLADERQIADRAVAHDQS